MPPLIQGLLNAARGAIVSPQAYGEKGVGGVLEAIQNPAPFEQSAMDAKFQKAYAPVIGQINESLQAGDFEKAMIGAVSLRKQMQDNNARPADIDRFAGGYARQAFQTGVAARPMSSPQGQDFAVQGTAVVDPSQAGAAAETAAGLPGRRMAAPIAQANIEQSQAATAQSRAQTEQVIPAQVRQYGASTAASEARARAYDRGEMGARGRNVNDFFRKNASLIQGYDREIQRLLKVGKDGELPDPQVVQGRLEARNMVARELGQPEAEITPIYGERETVNQETFTARRQGPLLTYALRPKPQPEQAPAQQQGAGQPMMPPLEAPPLAAAPAMQGAQGIGQRPPFQAAVQNPLGALPAEVQQAILNPSTPIPASAVVQAYTGMGYAPEEANALTDALLQQLGGNQAFRQPALSETTQPTRDPFQPPQF